MVVVFSEHQDEVRSLNLFFGTYKSDGILPEEAIDNAEMDYNIWDSWVDIGGEG